MGDLIKYLISRSLIVYICFFYWNWMLNVRAQLEMFFDIPEDVFFILLGFALCIVVFIIWLLNLNIILSAVNILENHKILDALKSLRNLKLSRKIIYYVQNGFSVLRNNTEGINQERKYPVLLILCALAFFYFSREKFDFHQYIGFYKEYEFESDGREGYYTYHYREESYIADKVDSSHIADILRKLDDELAESEEYFVVKKSGYLFIEAGVFDGYIAGLNSFKGPKSYLICFLYSALEKLIALVLFFFIPFTVCIATIELYANYKLRQFKRRINL